VTSQITKYSSMCFISILQGSISFNSSGKTSVTCDVTIRTYLLLHENCDTEYIVSNHVDVTVFILGGVQKTLPYLDILLYGTIFLLLSTVAVTVLYYGRIKKARKEYEEAKTVVSDVIVSFNRQLQRQEGNVSALRHKLETLSVKSEKITNKLEEQGVQLKELTTKFASSSPTHEKLLVEVEEIKKRVETLAKNQEGMLQRITETPETRIEAAIPIKKERALAPLTETELRVLEILADEGEKTTPEIRDRIKLTREHTARLMKKLYEGGYVERNSAKTPFTYRVKEEMIKILKKTETRAE